MRVMCLALCLTYSRFTVSSQKTATTVFAFIIITTQTMMSTYSDELLDISNVL